MKRLGVSLAAVCMALASLAAASVLVSGVVAAAPPTPTAKTMLALSASPDLPAGTTFTVTPAGGLDVSPYERVRVVVRNRATPAPNCYLEAAFFYWISEGGVKTLQLGSNVVSIGDSDTSIIDLPGTNLTIEAWVPACATNQNTVDVFVYGR